MISDSSVLITGGAGFIGSRYVVSRVRKKNVCVINLDALTYAGHLENLVAVEQEPEHHFVLGSIGDRTLVEYLMKRYRPRAVVHFAAETHVDRSIDSADEFIRTNMLGTYELLEATHNYWCSLRGHERDGFRFLQLSTDEVYGSLDGGDRFTENSPHRPNSPYAASKASSDHLVRSYYQTFGLPVLTINCSNNYGPRQFPEKLIPLVIHNALQGKPIPVYGNGENIRDWLFVDDLCRAIDRVQETGHPGEVYNVGGGNEMKNIDVVKMVCGMLDEARPDSSYYPHSGLIEFVEDRPGHDFRYAMDSGKIQRELGWTPQESFESGIRKTVGWYLDNQSWCNKVLEGIYSGERLGSKKSGENMLAL